MSVLFSIVITCFCYLFIPFIFILIGKKQNKTMLYLISLVSLIVGMIIMMFLAFYLKGYAPSGGGALLWTLIGNFMMKQKIGMNQESDINEEDKIKRDAKIGLFFLCVLGIISIIGLVSLLQILMQ